tara:strand:- start:494 stop:676 length:183 start_codon:yes stop_codon:yes gene_type:complete
MKKAGRNRVDMETEKSILRKEQNFQDRRGGTLPGLLLVESYLDGSLSEKERLPEEHDDRA